MRCSSGADSQGSHASFRLIKDELEQRVDTVTPYMGRLHSVHGTHIRATPLLSANFLSRPMVEDLQRQTTCLPFSNKLLRLLLTVFRSGAGVPEPLYTYASWPVGPPQQQHLEIVVSEHSTNSISWPQRSRFLVALGRRFVTLCRFCSCQEGLP